MKRAILFGALALLTMTSLAQALPPLPPADAPEIDASVAAGAITLVTGGLLMLRARFARK